MNPMAADDNGGMSTDLANQGVARLSHWGVIRARGADAARFLHGQLTSDMLHLGSSRAVPAGFCSAKGRLQASFVVWERAADELLLACAADLLPPTLKRLAMFVLRAQCKLDDASADWPLHGLVGEAATARLADAPVWSRRETAEGTLIRLPDAAGRSMVHEFTGRVVGDSIEGTVKTDPSARSTGWRARRTGGKVAIGPEIDPKLAELRAGSGVQ